MRISCNGCRVLRKACTNDCSIRPCLDWIKNPDSQSNATLFLAKFYGRAGLLNLINAGPPNLRPAIFRSLLYEACGRIINPVYGSAGLVSSGTWHLCQTAVDAVLNGELIFPLPAGCAPAASCDIRHVNKKDNLHRVRTRCSFKRSPAKSKWIGAVEPNRSPSHDSSLSHQSEMDGEIELDLTLGFEPVKRRVEVAADGCRGWKS